MNKHISPRMPDNTDRVDVSKLSVTELYGILNALKVTLNQRGTSDVFSDYFRPLREDGQDAFYESSAQSAAESLMKVASLTEDDIEEGFPIGLGILKEAQKFIGR